MLARAGCYRWCGRGSLVVKSVTRCASGISRALEGEIELFEGFVRGEAGGPDA
jgi:hypothetical protein